MADKKNWWEKKEVVHTTDWQALKTPEGLDYYYNTATGATTWDKPDELKSEDELKNQGEWVWMPHERDCYLPATVQSRAGANLTLMTQDGQTHTISSKLPLAPLKLPSLQRVVSDLVLLDDMSTPLILHNLKKRFERGDIYTSVGTILISINPYANLGLYTPEKIYEYQYRGVKEMPPHVFNIAHEAYKGLCDFKIPQSIIISGESGAGKTEATKQCLSYLAVIAGSVNNVEQKVLQANPILEAFGNAKTVRNDNSSRFGKYMEIFFDPKNKIVGSTTTNYLLEKIRVVQQQADERNFHIFYQLVKACPRDQRSQLQLANNVTDYFYLNQSGCTDVRGIDDNKDFQDLMGAMNELLFDKNDQTDVLSTTAAVLSLGNVKFSGGAKSAVPDKAWINVVARLLQVEPDRLVTSLTIRELKIKGQATTKVDLDEKTASDTRHALAKFIYGNMFDWIVQKINEAMKTGIGGGKLSVGILDIFGFEIFKFNSFEQLCINFTNEMLQQHFNNNTFKLEEQVYKNEGIKFAHVDFIDNQPVLDLITKKPQGVLCCLDEELVVPKGSDAGFISKLHTIHAKTTQYERDIKNPNTFKIHHYAGLVSYDSTGFLEKNRDTLTDDLLEMLHTSKSKFITALFPKDMSSSDKKSSLSKQFQGQLLSLMAQLNKTEPHYIRCVKPNDMKSPSTFVSRNCLEQLTYSGVFEAVSIRKQGFPFRLKHDVFCKHYACVMPNPNQQYPNPIQGCKEIIAQMKLNAQNVQMGSTMVLYRSEEHKALELQRSIKIVAIEMDENLKRLCGTNITAFNDQQKEKYFEELSRAVEQADEFRLKSDMSNRARKLLDDYIESRIDDHTKAMLQRAYDTVDQRLLEETLAICDKNGFKTKMCKECRRLLDRIYRINEEVEVASQTLEEKHVRVCVTAGDEIRLNTEWLNYFRDLVNGPMEAFLQAQFDAAKKLGQHDRAIRIGVRQKDLLFQKEANRYQLSAFPKLKNPMAWAGEKLFGNKEVLSAGFLQWQKDKIHAPLCTGYETIPDKNRQKEVMKKATTCFKYVMKYMGQRISKTETSNTRGRQMVSEGFQTIEIRDEIYIQIVKQCTNNPEPNAVKQGWDMMALCLLTFPPSAEFENYLEVILRQNAPSGKQTHQFVGWLRQRVYHGPVKTEWTEQDLVNIESTLASRSRGFSEPLPDGIPRYHDLSENFFGGAKQDNTFRREVKSGPGAGAAGHQKQMSSQQVELKNPATMYVKPELPKPKAPAPQQQKTAWKEVIDEASGDPYYYNEETGASQWDKPPELMYSRQSVAQRGW